MQSKPFNLSRRTVVQGATSSLVVPSVWAAAPAPSTLKPVDDCNAPAQSYVYATCWQAGNNTFGVSLKTINGQEDGPPQTFIRKREYWVPEWVSMHGRTDNGGLATQPMLLKSDSASATRVLSDIVSVYAFDPLMHMNFFGFQHMVQCSSAKPIPFAAIGTGVASGPDNEIAALNLALAHAGFEYGLGLKRAKSIILAVSAASENFKLKKYFGVVREFGKHLDDDGDDAFAYGYSIDNTLGDAYRVSILATL